MSEARRRYRPGVVSGSGNFSRLLATAWADARVRRDEARSGMENSKFKNAIIFDRAAKLSLIY
jgi:hypothetical protein